ncbi:hypothetical protein [Haloarcula sp. Atlit-7R]|uniref:hypothetical protein n=1 Tax=Haloarcula sp. Atlit-7R TaxID=2282125 RepID=UPI00131471AD|nr:hypothetical protein [Haloarcula sp. Atlit-7R]
MTEHEARESELRINEQDREAIKEARDKIFDAATPMGLVARKACQKLTEDTNEVHF